jgi:peptide/nickel transport system ATP-binding protein/oligopeptide transport system ATP-binding protein
MSEPLLQVQGLAKRFVAKRTLFGRTVAEVRAVDGVDLTLHAGETLAIVGESGCGKSTLGRLILRLIEPSEGRIVFAGEDITALGTSELRALRRTAQLIFQDPFASLNPRMTVGDILEEPLMLHAVVPAGERKARVRDILAQVGLRPDHASRYPHEFSGGQRQRIAIARAIAVEPRLIVCDEPVSALDVSIRAQILNLLEALQARLGLAYVFISHDLAVVKHIADRVAVMYLGRIVETGPAAEVFAAPQHPYTRALIDAIPIPVPAARRERALLQGDVPSPINPPTGCHLHTRCPFATDRCTTDRPPLAETGLGRAVACWHWREVVRPTGLGEAERTRDPRLERLMQAFVPAEPAQ